jgi:hypothetical protein
MKFSYKTDDSEKPFATKRGKDWLRGLLQSEKVTIVFEKKDGTLREMVCTLKDIPTDKTPKGVSKKESDEAIAVFDLDKNDWRSFRFDSVKRVQFDLGAD